MTIKISAVTAVISGATAALTAVVAQKVKKSAASDLVVASFTRFHAVEVSGK
jgi:hypothetical protein